ncbi:bacillithiol system redox-active protein YtxJ [Mesonia sp. MT50]|uniref:Bacillithiol system redox-active protein YtxJ n=1 Tax=Mesonia profundi TaxID=3070998 RepID=A0ABU0ZY39_9FLAO|nr:bacillithiol system redox-active protein YtxJ [Mesonia profundi]MDQ7916383.1 bacillithiol system redox-active protein YtxJ [Mesonia profundi]
MGLFDKIFKKQDDIAKEEMKEIPWHVLSKEEQLDQLLDESEQQPVMVFKHSTRCGVSRMVLKQFEKNYDLDPEEAKIYFLDLLQNRNVSNAVAEKFKVMHQSPQMIVLKNREVVHQASHHDISVADITV